MEIWNTFVDQLLATTVIEFLAVVFGIASVWFSKQEKILVYPTGIVSVGLYIFITYEGGIYADTGVNFYYLLMSIYGWFNWKNTKVGADQIPISKSSKKGNLLNFSVLFGSFFLLWLLLSKIGSDIPVWDALSTAFAITAMYLMALKKIEHWYFWIGTNLLSIPLYFYKGYPFSSFQFIVFLCIAVLGLMSWRRKLVVVGESN